MSRQTTNYGYNISEGSDIVNPLVDIFPNWVALDSDLKDVSNVAVGRATELTTGTVHALTRSDTDRNVFIFTATSNFTAGDTFTLDDTQVSALTPAGEQLATGCYIIGSDVLVAVHGTLMTMYVSPTKVADSDKLDGHDSTYFATASDLSDLSDDVDAISSKVGTGTLTTAAQDCVGAINELNADQSQTRSIGVYLQYSTDSSFTNFSNFSNSSKPVTGYKIAPKTWLLHATITPGNVTFTTNLYRIIISNEGIETSDIQILDLSVFARNVSANYGAVEQISSGTNKAYLRSGANPNVNWLPTSWNGTSDQVVISAIVRID